MNSSPTVPSDKPLTSIGYTYISQKVLGFLATEGCKSIDGNYLLSVTLEVWSFTLLMG